MNLHKYWVKLALLPLALLAGCATTDALPDMLSPVYRRTPAKREQLQPDQAQALALWAVPFSRVASHVYCQRRGANVQPKSQQEDCAQFPELESTGWALLYDSQSELSEAERASGLEFMAFARLLAGAQAERAAQAVQRTQPLEGLQAPPAAPGERGEIVIGFRGTDLTSLGDWRANLRWVTRFLPLPGKDQYEIVHQHASRLVDTARARARARFPAARDFDVYTTGHSLGGGLAQLLAYSDARVLGAVVFDPSPVTGYANIVSDKQVNCSARVVRIYERGEGLSYLRSILRRFYSISDNINEVSFDFIHTGGNPFANHSMVKFREGLEAKGGVDTQTPVALTGLPGAPDCDCYRLRAPEVRAKDAGLCAAAAP